MMILLRRSPKRAPRREATDRGRMGQWVDDLRRQLLRAGVQNVSGATQISPPPLQASEGASRPKKEGDEIPSR